MPQSNLFKGKQWLFAGHFDPDNMEGGMIHYQGVYSDWEGTEYVDNGGFDWAHFAEVRFGQPHITAFLNGGEWVKSMDVDLGEGDYGESDTP